jgi:hypothetical protein
MIQKQTTTLTHVHRIHLAFNLDCSVFAVVYSHDLIDLGILDDKRAFVLLVVLTARQ